MYAISLALVVFCISLGSFLNSSFFDLKKYNLQLNEHSRWQETSLTASKRLAIESSNFIQNLQKSILACKTALEKEQNDNYICKTDYQQILDTFLNNIQMHKQNQLNKTIKFGLEFNNKNFEFYEYELKHTNFFKTAYVKGDPIYNSKIFDRDLVVNVDLQDLRNIVANDYLAIDASFLKKIIGEENLEFVNKHKEQFKISFADCKTFILKEESLPNALNLMITLKSKVDDEKLLKEQILSGSQLRLASSPSTNSLEPICNQCNCPNQDPCKTVSVDDTTQIITRQELRFNIFEAISGRGFFYDQSQTISSLNPLNIVNTSTNRFTSVYANENNFLQVNLGYLNSSSVLRPMQRTTQIQGFDFASIVIDDSAPTKKNFSIETNVINTDIMPRVMKRYMTAKKDFFVNGKLVSKGSILIGTLKIGAGQLNIKLSDFENIRVYDKDSAALVQIFKPGQKPSVACANSACMDPNQFTIDTQTAPFLDAKIHTSFSTADLFNTQSAFVANELFLKIQRDLELNQVTGIYNPKYDWQKEILKNDLNSEQQVLLTNLFKNFDVNNLTRAKEIANTLGVSFAEANDLFLNLLAEKLILSFTNFAKTKIDFINAQIENSNNLKLLKTKLENQQRIFLALDQLRTNFLASKFSKSRAILLLENILDIDLDDAYYLSNGQSTANIIDNSKNNNIPPAPIAPKCMKKKAKNRSNNCKKKVKKYKNDLKEWLKLYS